MSRIEATRGSDISSVGGYFFRGETGTLFWYLEMAFKVSSVYLNE